VPLDREIGSRWGSAWEPFEDPRGLLGELHAAAGAAFSEAVDARVIRDDTGETPSFAPGERVPYYRRGALLFAEVLAGFTARLGDGKSFSLAGTLLAGFHSCSAPPARGTGSDSRTMAGFALAMEIALGF